MQPLIVLDIGSSLVDGPARGPAARVAAAAGLGVQSKRALHRLLMTTEYADPLDACAAVREDLGLADPAVESALIALWEAQESEARLAPGAYEALRGLVARGFRLALLSNIWTPYLRSVRRLLGEFFDAHIPAELQLLSCREGLVKPAPELFHRVLERAGADAASTLMVGDSYINDIQPAAACGMRTLWLLRDPVGEAAALMQILNGAATAPSLTLRSLVDIDSEGAWLSRVLAASPGGK
jgi:HAD superfamily hydrolase (TIGR01549 family)